MRNRLIKMSFYLLLVAGLMSCASKKKMADSNMEEKSEEMLEQAFDMNEILTESFEGQSFKSIKNESGTHTLCISDSKDLNMPYAKSYLVHDGKEIVYKLSKVNGEVQWHDDKSIAVTPVYGQYPKGKDPKDYKKIIPIKFDEN